MNILVLPSWYPSKADPVKGSFFAEQAAALARFGHTVTVMAVYNDGKRSATTETRTSGNLTEYLIHIKPLRFHFTYFRILRKMLQLLRKCGRPDIIHVHSFRAIRYARILSRLLGVPFVVTEHVTWFERNMFSPEELSVISRDYNAADAVVAVGEGLKKAIQPLCCKEVRVIPNMVNRKFLENGLHDMPKDGRFHFVCVCLLDNKKGVDILLKAFAELRETHPEICLTICGDGSEMDNLRALARELSLSDTVEFVGSCSREECARWLKRSQAFVLPSRYETFGIVFVEAMGCGLPIIMTETGAWEMLAVPETGLAVPVDDTATLVGAMRQLMEHYADYDAGTIRRYCRDNFSETAICRRLTELYEEILRDRKEKRK